MTFAATADNGLDTNAKAVFAGIGRSPAQATFVLGDLAYATGQEATYCRMVTDRVGPPVELLVGNHEDDLTRQGSLATYAAVPARPPRRQRQLREGLRRRPRRRCASS